jgi:hypothetical protein
LIGTLAIKAIVGSYIEEEISGLIKLAPDVTKSQEKGRIDAMETEVCPSLGNQEKGQDTKG